jgi:hypothetical protein
VMPRMRRSGEDERRARAADWPERGGVPVRMEPGMKRVHDEALLEAGTWSRR